MTVAGCDRRTGWLLTAVAGGVALLAGCAAPATSTSAASTSAALTSVAGTSVAGTSTAGTSADGTSVAGPSASGGTSAAGTTAPALPACDGGDLPTIAAGTLTFGTASAGAAPWFVGDPASGQGLESALAYSVAEVLGYDADQVSWVVVDRPAAVAGTAAGFDVDLDQFTAPDAGFPTVDYSTGYFSATEALLVRAGTPTPSLAAVTGLTLAAVSGAPDETASDVSTPTAFPSQTAAVQALAAQAVDGVLLPIQDALAAARTDPALAVAGQLPPDPRTQPTQFQALLPKGSPLTGCVSSAIDRLRLDGTLTALADQWVTPTVPVLS